MAEHPFMPFNVTDYLADASHLGLAEHGAYHLLLMHMWLAPGQRLPNDDYWLARKFRVTVEEVKTIIRPVIEEFCINSGNWITQKRLQKEYQFVSRQRKLQSDRAKSRWNKQKQNARAMPLAAMPPTPPHPTIKELPKGSSKRPTRATQIADDWQPSEKGIAYAKDRGLELTWQRDKFTDHHLGKGSKMVDWNAAWRTWCRNAVEFGQGKPGANGAKPAKNRPPDVDDAYSDMFQPTGAPNED